MQTDNEADWHTPERIASFVDGVVFVAMTILILTVELPDTSSRLDGAELLSALATILPNLFAYCASFLVIALYWMGYNGHFRRLRRIDTRMLWLVVAFVLLIGFVPFATSLIGQHRGLVSTTIYAMTMISITLVLITMSAHARRHGLFAEDAAELDWLTSVAPWFKIIAVFTFSIGVALLHPDYATASYALLAMPDRVFRRLLGLVVPRPRP